MIMNSRPPGIENTLLLSVALSPLSVRNLGSGLFWILVAILSRVWCQLPSST